jgi:uncharacterized protein (TIGR00297 family)
VTSSYSESRRQLVHIAMVGWAFALRVLSWPQAAALALAALLFNYLVLPRVGDRALFRPDDIARGTPTGILFYPLAVLLLILCFRSRLDITAAAWAILAVGDGVATLCGQSIDGARLPWNPEKTWAGTIGFFLAGAPAGVLLCWWTQPAMISPAPMTFVVGAPVLAAAVAALVESIPVRLDDNLSVPFAAAATLWVLSLVDHAMVEVMLPGAISRLAPALFVNAAFAATAFAEGVVSWSGVVAGVLIGLAIYVGAGWQGWTMLLAAFVSAAATSKVGWQRKRALGIAEEREGRRGAANALANCLVAAVAALLAISSPYQAAAWCALVTALTAGASDTVASEIGKAKGRRTFLVVGVRPVPPGTPGAISLEGTIAGVVSATLLATLGAALGLVPANAIWIVVVAATAGAFVESALAAVLEPRRILDNHLLNFINTTVAVAVALPIGPM